MEDILGRWGRHVYPLRWWLLALSALSLAPATGLVVRGAPLEAGTVLTTTESGRAAALISRELPGQPVSFDLILSSRTHRGHRPGLSSGGRAGPGSAQEGSAGGAHPHALVS